MPRNAVLMAGNHSVVYVETGVGKFELREVTLGPSLGDQIALLGGVQVGEQVAVDGNFLIDSQMQLTGRPSLIDPTKYLPNLSDQSTASEPPAMELPPMDLPMMELPNDEVTP